MARLAASLRSEIGTVAVATDMAGSFRGPGCFRGPNEMALYQSVGSCAVSTRRTRRDANVRKCLRI